MCLLYFAPFETTCVCLAYSSLSDELQVEYFSWPIADDFFDSLTARVREAVDGVM